MDFFNKKGGEYCCEDVKLAEIAMDVGTPCYVYSAETLRRHLTALKEAFSRYPTHLCFAVKSNCNLSILREIFSHDFGADLVSVGELEKALKAGVDTSKVVFSGVGKQRHEVRRALEVGILGFNVESSFELKMIQEVAENLNLVAPVNLRINPNIEAPTNPKIATGMYSSKFGIPESEALQLASDIKLLSHVELVGVACHIGSQMTDLEPLKEAAQRATEFAMKLIENGHSLRVIDMGGGLGIRYGSEEPPPLKEYADILIDEVEKTGLTLVIEPGRVIMGNVGVLLCSTIGVKSTPEKNFLVVDGAMNDLIRPSMYSSYHNILPVCAGDGEELFDVVGPICESSDFFGKDRKLPRLSEGDLIFVKSSGAYGSVMTSNYNSRARPAEVLVDGSEWKVIRRREEMSALWELEE